jgi:hypothetical protein
MTIKKCILCIRGAYEGRSAQGGNVDNFNMGDVCWTLSSKVCHVCILLTSQLMPCCFIRETLGTEQDSHSFLSISLGEIILQDSADTIDTNEMIPELVICACNDLRYGTSSISRPRSCPSSITYPWPKRIENDRCTMQLGRFSLGEQKY